MCLYVCCCYIYHVYYCFKSSSIQLTQLAAGAEAAEVGEDEDGGKGDGVD